MGRKKKTYDTLIRYPYERFYKLICAKYDRVKIADKKVGDLIGVSERQVRNAKEDGMDAYMADLFCQKGLGIHPQYVFGADAWVSPEAEFAADATEAKDSNIIREAIELSGWELPVYKDDEPKEDGNRFLTDEEIAVLDAVIIVEDDDESYDLLLTE